MQRAIIEKSTRYHALDIWRGLVCDVVVMEHAAICLWSDDTLYAQPGLIRRVVVNALSLNIGGPLFFVISGYCIASSLESSGRKGVGPVEFLGRRLWRIFPPYWASLVAIGGLVVLLDRAGLAWLHRTEVGLELFAPGEFSVAQRVGNVTLSETWRPLIAGDSVKLLNRISSALCYQEQFYLVCFVALILMPRRLHAALAVATLGSSASGSRRSMSASTSGSRGCSPTLGTNSPSAGRSTPSPIADSPGSRRSGDGGLGSARSG